MMKDTRPSIDDDTDNEQVECVCLRADWRDCNAGGRRNGFTMCAVC
jgi:hypothetical protein